MLIAIGFLTFTLGLIILIISRIDIQITASHPMDEAV